LSCIGAALHAAAARRRYDAIHAQIHHHLAVVIHQMRNAKSRLAGAGPILGHLEGILRSDGADVGMRQRQGVLQCFDDLCLGLELFKIGAVVHHRLGWVVEKVLICFGQVLDLTGETSDAFEFTGSSRRGKVEFVIGHGFGGIHNFLFHAGE
jgi:hypothetical protein